MIAVEWTLHAKSRLIRWAYLFDKHPPTATSLCALFWRIVLVVPLICAIALFVIGFVVYWVGYFFWALFHLHLIALLIVSGLFTAGLIWGIAWMLTRRRVINAIVNSRQRFVGSVVWQGAKAIKARMCPIVYITGIAVEDADEYY